MDGTHLPPAASVGLMRATAAALCGGAPGADGGVGGAPAATSSRSLAAEVSPAPSSPAGGLPAALYAAPAPPLGAGAYVNALLATAATVLSARTLYLHRAAVEAFVRTPLGGGGALGATVVAVALCDVWPVAPVVEKARAVGFDSMLLFVTLVAALASFTRAPVSNALPHAGGRAGGGKVATPERSASPAAGGGVGSGAGGAADAASGGGAPTGAASAPRAAAAAPEVQPPPAALVASAAAAGGAGGDSVGLVVVAGAEVGAGGEEAGKLLVGEGGGGGGSEADTAEDRATLAAENHGFFPLAQTLEFKGWMMSFFLMYHYWDVKPAYCPVRVCVGAYLFLTGFGNFLSLGKKGPSLQKLAMSVLRINFFPCLVMLTTGRAWVLYYIAPLHTLWTVVVYVYYWLPHPPHHKLFGILAAIVAVYELPFIADYGFLPLYPLLGYCGSLKEFVFRSRLDAYAPWCGMAFAFYLPAIVAALDNVEGPAARLAGLVPVLPLPDSVRAAAGALGLRFRPQSVGIGATLLAAFLGHSLMYGMQRFEYNTYHRATEWLPICTFLVLRNLTPALRRTHLRLYAWLGEMSLELYILQFHVWMAADAKKLTVLLPSFRGVSFAAATLAFVVLSWVSNRGTGVVLKFVEGQGRNAALGAAGALLGLMCVINMASPRACSAGGAGGR
jgi:hypothetical protein